MTQELNGIVKWWQEGNPIHYTTYIPTTLPTPRFVSEGETYVSFSSNNYLSLTHHPRVIRAAQQALQEHGIGNCESRLLGGDLEIYRTLESRLAKLKNKPEAILFVTGYVTNLGVLSSIPKAGQVARLHGFRAKKRYKYAYLFDEFCHISIREGMRMSGAERHNYRHCDVNHLESLLKANTETTNIIVTDGVFSQQGTIAPLPELVSLAEKYDAMVYIDDAHATGVLGKGGGGTSEFFNCYSPRIMQMGTLSKAFGSVGGFVAVENSIADALRLFCPAYGFTSTIPPDQACALLEVLNVLEDEPWRRENLWKNQHYFAEKMGAAGFDLMSTQTPILPVFIGDMAKCSYFSDSLKKEKMYVDAVQFPAVPLKQSRLRFIVNADHTFSQIDQVVDAMIYFSNQWERGAAKSATAQSVPVAEY